MTLSLALSLSLFALALAEAAPASWFLLGRTEAGLAVAYGAVLGTMACLVVVH